MLILKYVIIIDILICNNGLFIKNVIVFDNILFELLNDEDNWKFISVFIESLNNNNNLKKDYIMEMYILIYKIRYLYHYIY